MKAELKFKFKPQSLQVFKSAVVFETRDIFELDIVPEAKKNSPVTPEGLAHNEALHRKRPGGTGDNRRSIDSTVTEAEDGVHAELFTQSGHGGYLELGTSKMAPQPYLYPAFIKFIGKLAGRIKKKVNG